MSEQKIPKGWIETTLGKVCIKIGSGATPLGGQDSYKEKGISLIRSQNVLDYGFTCSGIAFIDQTQADNLSNVEVKREDVLINITGDSVARACMVPENILPARVNQHVSILRADADMLNSYYLKYYLLNPFIKKTLLILANSGATRNALTKNQLENFFISLPPLSEQRAIAAVLSSLDNKIELLREQNKTLEAIAQTLFKRWFVDFEFPDTKGRPYKSSGGKMQPSSLGPIPTGWRVGMISDIVNIFSGFAFSSAGFAVTGKYRLVTIKNVQDRYFDQETKDKIEVVPDKMPSYCNLKTGDILLSLTGNVGRVCLVVGSDYLLNQRVAKLEPVNSKDYAFSYLLFLQDNVFSLLQSTASGTAQQNLSPIQTKNIQIVLPSRDVLDVFGMAVNPLIFKTNENNSQIQTLSALRDTLLPKLMKGEVRVAQYSGAKS